MRGRNQFSTADPLSHHCEFPEKGFSPIRGILYDSVFVLFGDTVTGASRLSNRRRRSGPPSPVQFRRKFSSFYDALSYNPFDARPVSDSFRLTEAP